MLDNFFFFFAFVNPQNCSHERRFLIGRYKFYIIYIYIFLYLNFGTLFFSSDKRKKNAFFFSSYFETAQQLKKIFSIEIFCHYISSSFFALSFCRIGISSMNLDFIPSLSLVSVSILCSTKQ